MKEVLQGCCRELDISEVTDLQPTLSKLKAVVKAVPRMESFISAVCAYLFQRDEVVRSQMEASDKQPTLEDVLPTLKRYLLSTCWMRYALNTYCLTCIDFNSVRM